MTLICSKCGSGNIVEDMDLGNRLTYKKCLMCGGMAIADRKPIKEVDRMPRDIQIHSKIRAVLCKLIDKC